MWETAPPQVLVGVESTDCEAALLYAAEEARGRRCGLHLLHVAPLLTDGGRAGPPSHSVALRNDELHRVGITLLSEVAARLERELRDEGLPVTTELCRGAVVAAMVSESVHSCLVVVQRNRRTDDERSMLSTTHGVAARAHAPVAVVPADWRPPPPARTPVVTLGLQDAATSTEVARAAFEHAERADARLRVLHAYVPRRAGLGRFAAAAGARRRRRQLMAALAELLTEHPEVPVEITISPEVPADALLRSAADSSVLVLGRRRPHLPLSAHLGPVARSVLRRSPVPVLVVDPAPDDGHREQHCSMAEAAIP